MWMPIVVMATHVKFVLAVYIDPLGLLRSSHCSMESMTFPKEKFNQFNKSFTAQAKSAFLAAQTLTKKTPLPLHMMRTSLCLSRC